MGVYTVEVLHKVNSQVDIYMFDAEDSANFFAITEIVYRINSMWDLINNQNHIADAKMIEFEINRQDYAEARWLWNHCSSNCNGGYPYVYVVHYYDVMTNAHINRQLPLALNFPKPISPAAPSQISKIVLPSKPYVANVPGATCRHCKSFNDYAYADNPDGTFECFACKSMKQIFTS